MPITSNEGGVKYALDTIYSNEGGVRYALDTVYSNEGGVHYEIYRRRKGPKVLNWTDSSRGNLVSSANNGYSLSIYGYVSAWADGSHIKSQLACNSVISDEFAVKAETTITAKLTAITTGARLRIIVYDASGSVVKTQYISEIGGEAVFAFTEDGTYKLGLYTYYESTGQTTSYGSSNASLEITFA